MSQPAITLSRPGAALAKPINGTATPTTTATPSTASTSSSPFGAKSSSVSRKKPLGLDISRSIPKPSRAAPRAPGTKEDDDDGPASSPFMSEAERLREEIAYLQLSASSDEAASPGGADSRLAPATGKTKSGAPRKKSSSSSKTKRNAEDMVKEEDLETLEELGAGNGGTVYRVWNKKKNVVMARKLILVDAKPTVRKQVVRELQIMSDCSSPYIVRYYGCFSVDVHIAVVMEHMDAGSLDSIYRHYGAVPISIVGKVAEAVLRGLVYLYDVHRIIHRDIKPSNILANSSGEIKICDFGVSGELVNSIANTFVGTSTYMSPERIQGGQYTIKSDVWSLGISLVELAHGRFPFSSSPDSASEAGESPTNAQFDPDATLPLNAARPDVGGDRHRARRAEPGVSLGGGGMSMSILDLLQHIVNEPAPRLGGGRRKFPDEAVAFIDSCLDKDPDARKSPQQLLEAEWIRASTVSPDELTQWARSVTSPEALEAGRACGTMQA
ncbi:hypothetical protein Q5752_000419 [Cryptotrichosporon argae]